VIHRHAASVAAFVCTQRGATPEIPPALQAAGDTLESGETGFVG